MIHSVKDKRADVRVRIIHARITRFCNANTRRKNVLQRRLKRMEEADFQFT